ncbi:unnamed protein product [Ilex paraguariensis]|uniref:CRAL/TRIO N-terminal domain-containing protein n=1 Tax=Ilex paraguariensis TaxID=185542 RepID=A0ABC8STT2_9AQUA
MADETPHRATPDPIEKEKESPTQEDTPPPPPVTVPLPTPPVAAEVESVSVTEKETSLPTPPVMAEAVSVSVTKKETPLGPELDPPVKTSTTRDEVIESEREKSTEPKKIPVSLVSFKEESNIAADLSGFEKRALDELKQLVQEALNTYQIASPPPLQTQKTPAEPTNLSAEAPPPTHSETPTTELQSTKEKQPETLDTETTTLPVEICIWGVPLLKDDRSDVILLKFLRARDFKVKDAFVMLKNTIRWRKEFGIDELINEDLGDDLEKVVFMHGFDKDGHPVCYNVYGEFQNKELYNKTFADEEKRMKFLRWRIQFLERSIRKLDFSPGGICTIFQVSDLKNSPGPGKRELSIATRQALQLLQDNYPELVAKQVH